MQEAGIREKKRNLVKVSKLDKVEKGEAFLWLEISLKEAFTERPGGDYAATVV
jgi:hypothetical protein